MKIFQSLVPRQEPLEPDAEKEAVRKKQANIKARLAALDARISVKTRKPYVGRVRNAKLRPPHPI